MALNSKPDSLTTRIVFPAEIAEMACLPAWIEELVRERAIDERTHYAIHLCLEEAVSNVIRHGYAGGARTSNVTICCRESLEGQLIFAVEDSAPPFNPLTVPTSPMFREDAEIPIGGHGLRLLRAFADSLSYEPFPHGNRLNIGFVVRRS